MLDASRRKLIVQLLGFLVGVGLLGWCVREALTEENREQLSRLMNADAWLVGALLACSVGTLVLNGLIFWVSMLPVKRLSAMDVSATNAVATLISYAPFKLAVAFRILVHVRRDGVPMLTVLGWFGAIAVLALTVVGPAFGASLIVPGGTTAWWLVWLGGAAACTGGAIGLARVFAGDAGWSRLMTIGRRSGLAWLMRLLDGVHGRRVHAGVDMLAHARASTVGAGLRFTDLLVQAVRMAIAAEILGIDLDWADATVLASTYFAIGMISPIGMLGPREAGSAGFAALAGLSGAEGASTVVVISLLVSATEAVVNLTGAGLGAAWLRMDRWFFSRAGLRAKDEA